MGERWQASCHAVTNFRLPPAVPDRARSVRSTWSSSHAQTALQASFCGTALLSAQEAVEVTQP